MITSNVRKRHEDACWRWATSFTNLCKVNAADSSTNKHKNQLKTKTKLQITSITSIKLKKKKRFFFYIVNVVVNSFPLGRLQKTGNTKINKKQKKKKKSGIKKEKKKGMATSLGWTPFVRWAKIRYKKKKM